MKLLVLGASRGVGKELVSQALEKGHDVTALARNPAAIAQTHPRLNVVKGDVLDPASVAAAVKGQDAVLSTLGVTGGLGELFREVTLYSQGGRNLIDAMEREGVRRGLFVTSGGVEPVDPTFNFFYKNVIKPVLLGRLYEDMIRFEALLAKSTLDWTAVRPTNLRDWPRKPYRVSPRLCPPGGLYISRADVADFMLEEVVANRFVRGTPTLAY